MSQVTLTFSFPNHAAAKEFLDRAVPAVYTEADAAAHLAGATRPDPRPAKPDAKAPAAPAPKAPAPAPKPADKPAAIEYPVLQKAVFELAGKSKEKAKEVAAQFGVETFKTLAPEKYAEALAAVQAAIAELAEAAVA